MDEHIEPIETLITRLMRLPGVGRKSAQRMAYRLLDMPQESAEELAEAIIGVRQRVRPCPVCGNYTDVTPCAICADRARDRGLLCVVKDAKDVFAFEKMREFRGRYHVLGGTISPMNGVLPEHLRIKELLGRIPAENVTEVIIATDPDTEGEATAVYIAKKLKALGVKVTRIAYGIPIGGSLEYVDEMTLFKAMEGRREM